ncbi:MAG: hypothetical protein SGJ18_05510 [Pseudomonadota bacterium]|nr:hypothetical protein [Pseudomonadota bacterium]
MNIKIVGYIYLDEDDVKEIHDDQISKFGGSLGIRDHAGLASAVA